MDLKIGAIVGGDEAEEIGAVVEAGGIYGWEIVCVGHGCVDWGFELEGLLEGRN